MINVRVSVKNYMTEGLVKIIICGILVGVIVGVIIQRKLTNVYTLKIVHAKNIYSVKK